MLIDWLTLRFPVGEELGIILHEKMLKAMGSIVSVSSSGEIQWEKRFIDWDEIRSDSLGLFWTITADKDSRRFLTIGASPSSLQNSGVNVFGSLNIAEGCQVLIKTASKALETILPPWEQWDCRRMDLTANYDMGSAAQVKQALRLLLGTNAPRRKSNSDNKGGDSVYWSPKSDLISGKAYHKGAHLRVQQRKGKIDVEPYILDLADNLLRLEVKLGSRWFRRLKIDWRHMSAEHLQAIHEAYFMHMVGANDVEVHDMETLLLQLEKVCSTKGRALAAHRTWALIKTIGFTQTKESMPDSTFRRHCADLRAAGLSSADLCAGVVIPFRRKALILSQPVLSWDEIRRAA